MSPTAIDVHGFGGGFTLGARQAGWELQAKFSRGVGFGVLNALANHDLLGPNWDSIALPPERWEAQPAQLVFGNPPCAAFSTFNTSKSGSRGMDSSINDYMWELIRYAALVKPEMVIFESVQQTFRQGLPLMRKLREELESVSGLKYQLVHVLHNNATVGGCSIRRRYFWVATRVPFGVEPGVVRRNGGGINALTYVPTFNDVLRDLEPLGLSLSSQPYRAVQPVCRHEPELEVGPEHQCTVTVLHSSDWCRREVHDGSGVVDGHDIEHRPHTGRVLSLLTDGRDENRHRGVIWQEGTELASVMRDYVAKNGKLPAAWHYPSYIDEFNADGSPIWDIDENGKRHRRRRMVWKDERLIETDYAMGPHQPHRWHGGRMARVITGGGTNAVYHPRLNRTLTQREVARIQGFPDEWRIWPVRAAPDLGAGWGKGVPVQAARWVTYWARLALEGRPGADAGVPINQLRKYRNIDPVERESVVDVTNLYRPFAQAIGDPG